MVPLMPLSKRHLLKLHTETVRPLVPKFHRWGACCMNTKLHPLQAEYSWTTYHV